MLFDYVCGLFVCGLYGGSYHDKFVSTTRMGKSIDHTLVTGFRGQVRGCGMKTEMSEMLAL
jgi:hypothetical protein